MNRVVEMMLRCSLHAGQDSSSWEKILPTVEFVINNSPMQATGYTPFYLNYGFHPCTPVDLIHDSDSTLIEGVNNFVERMKKNFSMAVKFLHRAQDRMKTQADQNRRRTTIQYWGSGAVVYRTSDFEERTNQEAKEEVHRPILCGPSGGTSGL